MSNSSTTVLERIVMAARRQAYANARHLGFEPTAAATQANEAAAFINRVAASIPAPERRRPQRWPSWLWRS